MPFVPAENVVECTLVFDNAGEEAINTVYARAPGTVLDSMLVDLAGALQTWVTTYYMTCMSHEALATLIRLRDLTEQESVVYELPFAPGTSGGYGGPIGSQSDTLSIAFRTGFAGRSARGRNYVIGLSKDHIHDGIVDGARQILYNAAYGHLQAAMASVGFEWVVISRYSGYVPGSNPKRPAPRATAVIRNVTTWGFVDSVVDNQRRRLPKRGR